MILSHYHLLQTITSKMTTVSSFLQKLKDMNIDLRGRRALTYNTSENRTINAGFNQFTGNSTGKQCMVCSLYAIVTNNILPANEWHSGIVQTILIEADSAYVKICKEQNYEVGTMLDELDIPKTIHPFGFNPIMYVNTIVTYARNCNELVTVLEHLFLKDISEGVIILHDNISTALMKANDRYFYFDSHGLQNYGKTDIVVNVDSIKSLEDTFKSQIFSNDPNAIKQVTIIDVEVDQHGVVNECQYVPLF